MFNTEIRMKQAVNFALWLAAFAWCVMAIAARSSEPAAPKLPPTYLSGVVTYDPDGRYVRLITSTNRFHSCRDALDDTQSAQARAAEFAPPGSRTEGLCIPLHTYSVADLVG